MRQTRPFVGSAGGLLGSKEFPGQPDFLDSFTVKAFPACPVPGKAPSTHLGRVGQAAISDISRVVSEGVRVRHVTEYQDWHGKDSNQR
jgi:hypothetical protein